MKVVFLGTGNAFGSGGRHPVSILVEDGEFGVLLDCGPATLPALKKLSRRPDGIGLVLISHHHGDHFSGVPFLLLSYRFEAAPRRSFTVAGPPGTEAKVEQAARLLFPGLEPPRSFSVEYRELAEGEMARWNGVEVTPFRVRHFPQGVAFGYRLRRGEKTLVYSGDTEWTDELGRQSEGADLLIIECSTFEQKIDYHMSYRELQDHRDRIRARRILLIHAGEDVLARRAELDLELADDGQEVSL